MRQEHNPAKKHSSYSFKQCTSSNKVISILGKTLPGILLLYTYPVELKSESQRDTDSPIFNPALLPKTGHLDRYT